jgi:formylglycine-generating enzyme required for sulfatase activity
MTPQFYPVEGGHKILLAKSPKDDPRVKYRKEFDYIAREDEGEIAYGNRLYLDELRNMLKLLPDEADAIESEVLEPYRKRQEKLNRYEQALSLLIQRQPYPLCENDRNGLKRFQTILNLRDEDIAPIEERVLAPKKAEYERNLQQVEQRHQEAERLKRQQEAERRQQELEQLTQPFEFEVATLSVVKKLGWFGGEKVTHEIKRRRGRAEFFTEDLGNRVTLEMAAIPGGIFLMGSPQSEPERRENEGPQYTVTLQPFFMGKFPVTQAQWQAVARLPKVNIDLEPEPSRFKGVNRPVEQVSWYEAVEFCARLSRKTAREYRLPSEAEWEYACRAGTTSPFYFGETISPELANYDGNYTYASGSKGIHREQTTEVGSFSANAFGLYDMHGNVWEWCADHWHENYDGAPTDGSVWLSENASHYRLLRGGSWSLYPEFCRSAYRTYCMPFDRINYFGLRVVGVRG